MSNDPLIEAITPKTDWFVVLRPFQGDGNHRYVRGEVVDASKWVHHKRLIDLRYVTPLPHGAQIPDPDDDGRRIILIDEHQADLVPEKKRPTPTRKRTTSA